MLPNKEEASILFQPNIMTTYQIKEITLTPRDSEMENNLKNEYFEIDNDLTFEQIMTVIKTGIYEITGHQVDSLLFI